MYFPRYDYRRQGGITPQIIYINSAFDGKSAEGMGVKTVGLFNAEECERTVCFALREMGVESTAEICDVWSGESVTGDCYSCILPPHGSKLLKVTYANKN